jgi:hypothetical protein
MVETKACNCFICSKEFNCDQLENLALSKINETRFKVCQGCFDNSDPSDDYRQVREIISSYLWFGEAKGMLKEAKSILADIKKR